MCVCEEGIRSWIERWEMGLAGWLAVLVWSGERAVDGWVWLCFEFLDEGPGLRLG